MKLILLGAPGAGKGTQSEILSQKLNIPTISTGNILRAAIRDGTPIGLKAKGYIDAGNLVPDEVIIGIIKDRLSEPDCKDGYILDGVPRTIKQAEAMENLGIEIDKALSIEVDDDTIVKRMSGRRTCPRCSKSYHVISNPPKADGICDSCGTKLTIRVDDDPTVVLERLKNYHRDTEPLKDFYAKRNKLQSVQNQPTIEATTAEILAILGL